MADLRVFLMEGDGKPDAGLLRAGDIVVRGKADMTGGGGVSGKTGEGVEALLEDIARELSHRMQGIATATHQRHRVAMQRAVDAIAVAGQAMHDARDAPEIAAEHLREAMAALDSLTGRIDIEAILGEIFSSFCIGK